MGEFEVGDRVWVQTDRWSDDDRTGYAIVTRLQPEGFTEVQFEPVLVTTERLEARRSVK